MKKFLKVVFASFIGVLLALFLSSMVLLSIIGTLVSFTGKTAPDIPGKAILKIDFSSDIRDRGTDDPVSGLMGGQGDASVSLLDAARAIELAAFDPSIEFIYLNTDYMATTPAVTEEIRNSIARFRESGKPVIAYGTNFTLGGYHLASVADKIFAGNMATMPIAGISSNVMFFKGILDKFGIDMQLVRSGKYKAAGEQFTRRGPSDENKEQILAYINSMWNTMAEDITSARKIDRASFEKMVDGLEISDAVSARKAGLVDSIMYHDQLMSYLCNLYGTDKPSDMKFVSLNNYIAARIKEKKASDKVAVLYAEGDIVSGKGSDNITSENFMKTIEEIRNDSSVKAVVLRVNSPGGSAQAAEEIARELRLIDKPVIASFGDYAASGGYWISAESDYIYTSEVTLTGSIGVFSLVPNIQKGLNDIAGINIATISTHSNGNFLDITGPLSGKGRDFLENMNRTVYSNFLNLVSEGRDMSVEDVDAIAQGRVWTGHDAVRLGLADKTGGILDAISHAAAEAGLEDYTIAEYPKTITSIEKIMEMLYGYASVAENISDPASAMADAVGKLDKEKINVMARLPYMIRIR